MNDQRECPECGSHDTENVYTDQGAGIIEQVWVCNDSHHEYVVAFGNLSLREVRDRDGEVVEQ